MACLDVDDDYARKTPTDSMSVIMTTIVGVAVWELWSRHLMPAFFLQELSLAEFWLLVIGDKGRLTGELIYFLTLFPLISIIYFYLVKPIMETASPFCHWFSHGLAYGVVLFTAMASFTYLGSHLSGEDYLKLFTSSYWFIGAILTGLSMTGFLRLRALGREII